MVGVRLEWHVVGVRLEWHVVGVRLEWHVVGVRLEWAMTKCRTVPHGYTTISVTSFNLYCKCSVLGSLASVMVTLLATDIPPT